MSATLFTDDWATANQRFLMAELTLLRTWLGRPADGQPDPTQTLQHAREAMPAPPALDTLCTIFGLSEFERRVLLLCAGVELDGGFSRCCASAPGSNGNAWPSFAIALAAIPGAHWDAIANTAPLRRWRLVEPGGGPLMSSALRIDERILFYLTGISALDERLAGLIRPLREPADLA